MLKTQKSMSLALFEVFGGILAHFFKMVKIGQKNLQRGADLSALFKSRPGLDSSLFRGGIPDPCSILGQNGLD